MNERCEGGNKKKGGIAITKLRNLANMYVLAIGGKKIAQNSRTLHENTLIRPKKKKMQYVGTIFAQNYQI